MKKVVLAILFSFNLTGCLITEWEDVSNEPEFKQLIGVELISKEVLKAHGITMGPNYEKFLNHYTITRLPGISGPEVLSVSTLPIGTEFRITKVIRCIDCLCKYEKVELKILKGPKLEGAPSYIGYDLYKSGKNEVFFIKIK